GQSFSLQSGRPKEVGPWKRPVHTVVLDIVAEADRGTPRFRGAIAPLADRRRAGHPEGLCARTPGGRIHPVQGWNGLSYQPDRQSMTVLPTPAGTTRSPHTTASRSRHASRPGAIGCRSDCANALTIQDDRFGDPGQWNPTNTRRDGSSG